MILFGLDIDRPCAAMYRKEELSHLASVLFFFLILGLFTFFCDASGFAEQQQNQTQTAKCKKKKKKKRKKLATKTK